MGYFVSCFERGQFRDLRGLDKLLFLLESSTLNFDNQFLENIRHCYKHVPLRHHMVLEQVPSDQEMEKLRNKDIGKYNYFVSLKMLKQNLQMLFVAKGMSANFMDFAQEDNPKLAAAIVMLMERIIGEKLPEMRKCVPRDFHSYFDAAQNGTGEGPWKLLE